MKRTISLVLDVSDTGKWAEALAAMPEQSDLSGDERTSLSVVAILDVWQQYENRLDAGTSEAVERSLV